MRKILLLIGLGLLLNTNFIIPKAYAAATPCEVKKTFTLCPKPIEELPRNFNNKIEIIFSDIDGTLVPLDKGQMEAKVPKSSKDVVKTLKKANIPLVLATGRPFIEAKELAQKMNYKKSYIIAQQGNEIRTYDGKVVFENTLNPKATLNIIEEFEKLKEKENLDTKVVMFVGGKPYSTEDFKLPYNWAKITVLDSYKDLGEDLKPTTMVFYETNPQKVKLIKDYYHKLHPDYHVFLSTDCYCEIAIPGSDKGRAVQILADKLGYDLKNAAVFGDAENDISMIEKVKQAGGLSVATGNAMPNLKKHSEFVTSSVRDGGELKAVKIILENNKRLVK